MLVDISLYGVMIDPHYPIYMINIKRLRVHIANRVIWGPFKGVYEFKLVLLIIGIRYVYR